jgi:hypothetical protein
MPDYVDRESLRANHVRRLQKLAEQRALQGYATDPKIDLEIEDIQAQLRALETLSAPDANQAAGRAPGGASSQRPDQQDSSTHISATFNGQVGNVHTGSGDINVTSTATPVPEIGRQGLIGLLRRGVRDYASPDLAEAARMRVDSLENAFSRHNAEDAEDALSWLLRRLPALAGPIHELRKHLSDGCV